MAGGLRVAAAASIALGARLPTTPALHLAGAVVAVAGATRRGRGPDGNAGQSDRR
jgi:hypothetical protein